MSRKAQSTPSDILGKQYIEYFNRRRNAGIDCIGTTADQSIAIRYKDGREDVVLRDIVKWTDLFDKLSELHPPKPPA